MEVNAVPFSHFRISSDGRPSDQIPRYVRINPNLVKPEELVAKLQTPEGGAFTLLSEPYPETLPPSALSASVYLLNIATDNVVSYFQEIFPP